MTYSAKRNRRIIYLWLPYLAIERILLKKNSDAKTDTIHITVKTLNNTSVIDSVNQAAERSGLCPGTGLAYARAMFPDLSVEPADPSGEGETLLSFAASLERFTPLVATHPSCGVVLDITGCAHLFGGEQELLEQVITFTQLCGFTCNAWIADNVLCAQALCSFAKNSTGIFHRESDFDFLIQLTINALDLPEETIASLTRLGFRTIADVLHQSRASLVQRFGPQIARRIDEIEGRRCDPISPMSPVADFLAERRFAEPIFSVEGIFAALMPLATTLTRALEKSGKGAKRLSIKLFHCDGRVRIASAGASEPLDDPKRIVRLLKPQIEALSSRIETDSGIDILRLSADETAHTHKAQVDLYDHTSIDSDIKDLIDILSVRLGAENVQRFVSVDTHDPQAAGRRTSALKTFEQARWPKPGSVDPFWSITRTPPSPRRPLRVLEPPEPIEALAGVPDGPPVRFLWRRVFYHVAAAEGPERIGGQWWQDDDPFTLDYFAIEDINGRRFWICRRGLYSRETSSPRWYMNGFFA